MVRAYETMPQPQVHPVQVTPQPQNGGFGWRPSREPAVSLVLEAMPEECSAVLSPLVDGARLKMRPGDLRESRS